MHRIFRMTTEEIIKERMNRAMSSKGKTFFWNPRSKFHVKRKIKDVRLAFGNSVELTFFRPLPGKTSRLFTVAPVRKVVVDGTDVLYFDIGSLDYMPNDVVNFAERSRRMNTRTRPYNRSRSAGPSLTATEPMVQDTNGSSATVSFDISDLNYA